MYALLCWGRIKFPRANCRTWGWRNKTKLLEGGTAFWLKSVNQPDCMRKWGYRVFAVLVYISTCLEIWELTGQGFDLASENWFLIKNLESLSIPRSISLFEEAMPHTKTFHLILLTLSGVLISFVKTGKLNFFLANIFQIAFFPFPCAFSEF